MSGREVYTSYIEFDSEDADSNLVGCFRIKEGRYSAGISSRKGTLLCMVGRSRIDVHSGIPALWWSTLPDTAELAVVVARPDGGTEYVSPFLASLAAESAASLTGRDFVQSVVVERYRERAHRFFLSEVDAAARATDIIPIRSSSGEEVHVRWTRLPADAAPGRRLHIATGVNVTAEVRQAREIGRARRQLSELQAAARIGLWDFNHETKAIYWSDEMYRIFGADPHALAPSYALYLSRVHEEDREEVDRAVRASVSSAGPCRIRHRIGLTDGRTRWVEQRMTTAMHGAGKPALSRGTVQDVTSIVEAEEATRRSGIAVSSFLQASPEAVMIVDADGVIQAFSDGAEAIFRTSRSERIGAHIDDLIPDRFRPDHRNHLRAFVRSGRTALRMSERSGISAQRATGEEFAAEATIARLPGAGGELFAVILRDLSERKAYEAALESAKDRAEAANTAKSAFLATMSHEIRTPMNAVLGMLSVLAMEELKPNQQEMVEIAIDAGQSLMEILNNILDYSRIEEGQLRLEFVQFEIRDVLKRVQTLHAFKLDGTDVSLDVTIDSQVPDILLGDPSRLRQILHNLLSNAMKFTPKGRVHVNVSFEGRGQGSGVLVLDVADTGIGISRDQLVIIFDRFTQADSSITRRFGGSGLGLSIVSGIVEAMNGEISVKSEPDKGSCFTVRIPVPVSWDGRARETQTRQKSEAGRPPLRVLIADGNILNAGMLGLLLDRSAVAVSVARNNEEILKLFVPGQCELVFMDVQMPVFDGETAVKVLRRLEAETPGARAVVVACVDHLDEASRARYHKMGFDHAIRKAPEASEIDQLMRLAEMRIRWAS